MVSHAVAARLLRVAALLLGLLGAEAQVLDAPLLEPVADLLDPARSGL